MVTTCFRSSSGHLGLSAQTPPTERLATGVEARNRLYRHVFRLRAPSKGAISAKADIAATECNETTVLGIVASVAGFSSENRLRMEIQRLQTDSESNRSRVMELEMQFAALIESLARLRKEHQTQASHRQRAQMTATVRTIRENLKHLMEIQRNASALLPGMTVSVENGLTQVKHHLEMVEAVVRR